MKFKINLNECLIYEVSIKNKREYLLWLWRSPSQTQDELNNFLINFEELIGDINSKNQLFVLVTGHLKVRSTYRLRNDLSRGEGNQVNSLMTSYDMSQIISDPTHILPNSCSSFDLIFTNQPNLVTKKGVRLSLHLKHHHETIFTKLNLR